MSKITIDGTEYEIESLSQEALAQLGCLQFVDQEIERLDRQTAAMKTARNAYARALAAALPQMPASDTLKL